MILNYVMYDVEKYYLKWLRVLGLSERTWVRVLCMPIVCIFVIIVLMVCWATFLYEIMLELCVLARNISWPGGLALIWHGEG